MLDMVRSLLLGIGVVYLAVRFGHLLYSSIHGYRLSALAGEEEGNRGPGIRLPRHGLAAHRHERTAVPLGRSSD